MEGDGLFRDFWFLLLILSFTPVVSTRAVWLPLRSEAGRVRVTPGQFGHQGRCLQARTSGQVTGPFSVFRLHPWTLCDRRRLSLLPRLITPSCLEKEPGNGIVRGFYCFVRPLFFKEQF